MGVPWRAAEAMHWQLGHDEIANRANQPVFQLSASAISNSGVAPSTSAPSHTQVPSPGLTHAQPLSSGFQPVNATQGLSPIHAMTATSPSQLSQSRRRRESSTGRRRADSVRSNHSPRRHSGTFQPLPSTEMDRKTGRSLGPPTPGSYVSPFSQTHEGSTKRAASEEGRVNGRADDSRSQGSSHETRSIQEQSVEA